MEQPNDHDNLITLVADVKNLTKSQTEFHKEMKDSFTELKNNYSVRLENHDTRIQNLEITRTDFRQKLDDNKNYTKLLMWIGILLAGILIWHLTGYNL